MSDTQEADAPLEPVPHVDIMKSGSGWLALIHPLDTYLPRIISGETLDDVNRRVVSALVDGFGVSEARAVEHVSDIGGVRNVESTIAAAYAKGVSTMAAQLQDANAALSAAREEFLARIPASPVPVGPPTPKTEAPKNA